MTSTTMTDLTNEQMKAVSHPKGAACIIAGAGTGKTKALTERIFFLVDQCKIEPQRIIVTTFTRKATAELYDRAFERLSERALQLRISTIDALIWDLARQAMHQGFIPPAQLIGEPNKRVLLLYSAWEEFGNKHSHSRNFWTENAGQAGLVDLLEQSIRADMANMKEKQDIHRSIKQRLAELKGMSYLSFAFIIPRLQDLMRTAKRYYEKLKELSATDYELLRRDFLLCLKRHKRLAREFASQTDSILVDEFQDVSRIQAEILLLLSGRRRNIWVVGDTCQQIYEWRGAGPENLLWFIRTTKAKKYFLTDNWRSTQAILDCGYHFLRKRVPSLKRNGMLKPLISKRDQISSENQRHPVYTATIERALFFVTQLLKSNPNSRTSDIAILSSQLTKKEVKEIEKKAHAFGLKVQLHSSHADGAMEKTIGSPLPWKPGKVLDNLYKRREIQGLVKRSLRTKDFSDLRTIRPLAAAAEALDSTLPPQALSFREGWPALRKTQDREVSVSSAIVDRPDAIQVMTIHAAKGLEFPIVLLMKFGKGGQRSFPNPKHPEDCRLAYVGATRARDVLILVHTVKKPIKTLCAFGNNPASIRGDRTVRADQAIKGPTVLASPPIIAATHLDLYEQCPLKFATYHEGRLLPTWNIPQSIGSRTHKALEYYLRGGMPTGKAAINDCFDQGFQHGDSPLRTLPQKSVAKMKQSYERITKAISKTTNKVLAIEQRYRYLQGRDGQVDGVVDAIIEQRDGVTVLKEWKTSAEIPPDKRQAYTLQASVGALGIAAQNSHPIQRVEIVPVVAHSKSISLPFNERFVEETNKKLEQVFRVLKDRKYEPHRGDYCKSCQLKSQCPAWPKGK